MAVLEERNETIRGPICSVIRIHVSLFVSDHERDFCFQVPLPQWE